MKGESLSLRTVAALVALFAVTRVVVHLSGDPYFDPDSYKYLAGADSLLSGKGLPKLFTDLPLSGGALHLVPGYSFLTYALWEANGVTIRGLAILQSIVSLLGLLAFASLIARWLGAKTGIAVFVVLCLSPSIAWLEHSLTPDSIAAPLLMMALWASAWGSPSAPYATRRFGGAVLSGLIMGAEVLMRTSSQAYAPVPVALALCSRAGMQRTAVWTTLYALSALAPLAPWMLANHERHGVYAVAASSGRNLYFNAVWAGTIDRAKELGKYGIKQDPVPRAAYPLTDAALQRQINAGLRLPKADAKLRETAWNAYKSKPWTKVAGDRLAMINGLFVPSSKPGSESLTPLAAQPDWYLANQNASAQVRQTLEERFRYRFSEKYLNAVAKRTAPDKSARWAFREWIDLLSFDGRPLLIAFSVAVLVMLVRSPLRLPLTCALVVPVVAFLAVFGFFGAPLYRYQTGLHPFMLATIVVACVPLLQTAKRRLPAGWRMRRRLAGYGQADLW